MSTPEGFQVKARDRDGNVHDEHWSWSRDIAEGVAEEVRNDPLVTDARVEPPAITVTLALTGLPLECPHCGEAPPGGSWALGVHHYLLHVMCSACYTIVAPVRAVAA